jgi:hypothetical protein
VKLFMGERRLDERVRDECAEAILYTFCLRGLG